MSNEKLRELIAKFSHDRDQEPGPPVNYCLRCQLESELNKLEAALAASSPAAQVMEMADNMQLLLQAREQETWDLAHSPAKCGHARANYKDPKFGTPEYLGEEKCEACAALRAERRKALLELITHDDDGWIQTDVVRALAQAASQPESES